MRAREFLSERSPELQKVRSDIADKVNTISDIDELHKIYSYIRKIDVGAGFEEIFAKDQDLKQVQNVLSQAIIDANGSFEEKMAFAKEMVNPGIINIKQLLTPGVPQNILDIVVTKYPNLFKQVAPSLMNLAGSYLANGKKTQRGKGEFFLALSSPHITMKSSAGDLNIGGKNIEVKANLARIKGRKGYGTTDGAYSQTKKNISEFFKKNLPNVQAPGFVVTVAAKSTFWSDFGPFCIQNGVKPNLVSNFVKTELKNIIKSIYLNLDSTSVNSLISNVNESGVLDFKEFYLMMKKVAYAYYQAADHFDGMIVISGDTMEFIYVDSPETFQQMIKVKKLGFDTGQQNGMQITI
jgi:hypothetical protein